MRRNSKIKHVSPSISCCTSHNILESIPLAAPVECSRQCPCSCRDTLSPNICDPCHAANGEEQTLCPRLNLEVRMSQKNVATCSDVCRELNQISMEEEMAQFGSRMCPTMIDKRIGFQSQNEMDAYCQACRGSMSSNIAQKSRTSSIPSRKLSCNLSCQEHDSRHADQRMPPCQPRCENDCPAIFSRIKDSVEDSKQTIRMRPMPPVPITSPKRPASAIASETNKTMQAVLPKKSEDVPEKKDLDKKSKKKESSKTNIKNKKNSKTNISESCSCTEVTEGTTVMTATKDIEDENCTCHFPPAYSEFFHCTGKITGTCYCAKHK